MGASAARSKSPATLVDALGDAPSDGGSIPPASTFCPLRFRGLSCGGVSVVPILVPTAGWSGRCRRPEKGGNPPAIGTRERRHPAAIVRSEEHTSELQSLRHLVCRLLLEK